MRFRFTLLYAALFLPFAIVTPYLQILLRIQGFSREHIGLILGVLEVMGVAAPPVLGYLADASGKPRIALLITALGSMVWFLLFGVTHTIAAALVIAVLFGFFYRTLIPLTDGFTFRYISLHGGDYGMIRVGGSVAFVALIVVLEGLGIGETRSGSIILGAMVAAGAIHLISIWFLPTDRAVSAPGSQTSRPRPDFSIFLSRTFILFTISAFLGRVAMMSYYGFFSLFLREEIGFAQAGYIWMLGPLSEIPVIYFSTRIMKRTGVRGLFALGLAGAAVRLIGFSLVSTVAQIVPLQVLHALTFGAFHTASVTYVSSLVPPRMKGSAQTLFAGLTVGLGGIIGGVLGGYVAEQYGFAVLYRIFGCIALAGLVLFLFAVPQIPQGQEHPGGNRQIRG